MTGRHRRENPEIVLGCLRPRFLGAALVLLPFATWRHRKELPSLWRDLDSRSGGDLQSSPVERVVARAHPTGSSLPERG